LGPHDSHELSQKLDILTAISPSGGMELKCARCGSEYNSDSDLCYACGLKRDELRPARLEPMKRIAMRVLALGLLVGIGVFLVACAAILVRTGQAAVSTDWIGIAYFGAYVTSIGIGLATYWILGPDLPITEIRKGRRPTNKRAAAVFSGGVAVMSLVLGYLVAAVAVDAEGVSFGWIGAALLCSSVSLMMSVLELPAILFTTKDQEEASWQNRRWQGVTITALGIVIQVGTYVYGYERNAPAERMLLSFLVGVVAVIAGITILNGPSVRPWIWTGVKRQI